MNLGDLTIERRVRFGSANKRTEDEPESPKGRVPHIAKLMALAIRMQELVRTDAVANFAELALLGRVSRARVTQIMNLLNLAPDIQEAILFLPRIERGRALIILSQLQPIAAIPEWSEQRLKWKRLHQR